MTSSVTRVIERIAQVQRLTFMSTAREQHFPSQQQVENADTVAGDKNQSYNNYARQHFQSAVIPVQPRNGGALNLMILTNFRLTVVGVYTRARY